MKLDSFFVQKNPLNMLKVVFKANKVSFLSKPSGFRAYVQVLAIMLDVFFVQKKSAKNVDGSFSQQTN